MFCPRKFRIVIAIFGAIVLGLSCARTQASDTVRVKFDIPDKIECQDVTPEKCAKAHPTLKVVEVKFRISAFFADGNESNVVDFDYMITSPSMRLKILDYLPNTKLESIYADDLVEVADMTESTETSSEEAKVAYSLLSLTGGKNQTSKKTEQNKYQRIASKALVLASGTTNRGHGVFYKLRPSKVESLEGAKEFSFLAVVPRQWRGDWCSFACVARANKKVLLSTTAVIAGVEQSYVGLYLRGDQEASDLAASLCQIQQADDRLLARQLAKEATVAAEAAHAHASSLNNPLGVVNDLFLNHAKLRFDAKSADRKLEDSRKALLSVEGRLGRLSGTGQ